MNNVTLMLRLGVFDAGEFLINTDGDSRLTGNKTLDQLFEIVPAVEALGFSRYWLGEHYEYGVAWRNPEILLAILCGMTDQIRIGVAGVKLNLHHPLLVAQNFKMLEYLFSGRIDLGLAKGAAEKEILDAFRIDPQNSSTFEDKVAELFGYFLPGSSQSKMPPYHFDRPQTWVLGTSGSAIPMAVKFNLNFCFSLFHYFSEVKNAQTILSTYKESMIREWEMEPNFCLAIAGICSSSVEKAEKLRKAWKNNFFVPTMVGNDALCHEHLLELQSKYGVKEIIFMPLCYDKEDKLECYSLLSEKLKLSETFVMK